MISYLHCCSCLGLFMSDMCGLNMGCDHYLCDSCVCRHRGDANIGNGRFDFPCPERQDDGSICGEIKDLTFMDEANNSLMKKNCFFAGNDFILTS